MKQGKLQEILFDMYREAYQKATPSADFDELNEKYHGDIPFTDYYIPHKNLEEIFDRHISKYKLSRNEKNSLSFSYYLGCTPSGNKNILDKTDKT